MDFFENTSKDSILDAKYYLVRPKGSKTVYIMDLKPEYNKGPFYKACEKNKYKYGTMFDSIVDEIINILDTEQHSVFDILNKMQETYTPKIKMPQKIMMVFMEMKFNYQVDFEFFWKLMGDCVATDYLRENYKEEEIMMAWLYPELIEVSDD